MPQQNKEFEQSSPTVSQHDWSLNRKGQIDQQRHRDKLREEIKKNGGMKGLLADREIGITGGGKKLRVPMRLLPEPGFKYPATRGDRVGSGRRWDGEPHQKGDIIWIEPQQQRGLQGGTAPGEESYVVDFTEGEWAQMWADEMQVDLPRLLPTKKEEITNEEVVFNDIRKSGPLSNLDKKRTILENMKRNAAKGTKPVKFSNVQKDDLRFKSWESVPQPSTTAVEVFDIDRSTSMIWDENLHLVKGMTYLITHGLRQKYAQVKVAFIVHDAEAKRVNEHEFFSIDASGGTIAAPSYKLARELITTEFASDNAYMFHFSDGMVFDTDDSVQEAKKLAPLTRRFAYIEVGRHEEEELTEEDDEEEFNTLGVTLNKKVVPFFPETVVSERVEERKDINRVLQHVFSEHPESIVSRA